MPAVPESVADEPAMAETARVPVVAPPPPPGPGVSAAGPGASAPRPGGPAPGPGGPAAGPGASGPQPVMAVPAAGNGRMPPGAIPVSAFPDGTDGYASRNAFYAGHRLEFERTPEPSFDPLVNRRFLVCLWRQAGVFAMIYVIGAIITGVPALVLSLLGLFFLGLIWNVCAIIVAIALIVVFLVIPVPALLSEWKYLVDDKGAAGQATLGHIYYALQRRRTPLDSAGLRRLNLPGGETRDFLELRRGIFTGYISSFAQGNDLFVSWTFWLRLTPARWLWMLITRVFQEVFQRGNDLYVTLRYESAKAMRESMHSAAREGIDVASGLLAAPGTADLSALAVSTTQFAS